MTVIGGYGRVECMVRRASEEFEVHIPSMYGGTQIRVPESEVVPLSPIAGDDFVKAQLLVVGQYDQGSHTIAFPRRAVTSSSIFYIYNQFAEFYPAQGTQLRLL